VINDKGKAIDLQFRESLGGTACSYIGCLPTHFDTALYSSMCGVRPPPALGGSALGTMQSVQPDAYSCNSAVALAGDPSNQSLALRDCGVKKLQAALGDQHCSRGVCGPLPDATVLWGTQQYPVPNDVHAALGRCICKDTPSSDVQGRDVCHTSVQTFDWSSRCCNGFSIGKTPGKSPFYGPSCSERCACFNSNYKQGTCSFDGSGLLSTACSCRSGFFEGKAMNDSTRLFCGATCRFQCRGIVNKTAAGLVQVVHNLGDACPAKYGTLDSPPYQDHCYDNLRPCSGHGHCYNDGLCTRTGDASGLANCSCWGQQVNMHGLENNIFLPDRVVLYGGGGCEAKAPGVDSGDGKKLLALFDTHYELLQTDTDFSDQESMDVLELYASLYETAICSGHGYCTISSLVIDGELVCHCNDNWGGPRCDKHCGIQNNTAWGAGAFFTRPYQALAPPGPHANKSDITSALYSEFGLDVCGPHMICATGSADGTLCKLGPGFTSGHYSERTYGQDLTAYLNKLWNTAHVGETTPADTAVFVQQWAMAFVGEKSTCADTYYSSYPVAFGTVDKWRTAVPALVRWHLSRTCDVQYAQNQWSDGGTPWCCSYKDPGLDHNSPIFADYQDEAFALSATQGHGGCPDDHCPAYATGRSCRECRNSAFTHYQPATKGDSSMCAKPVTVGYCTKCAVPNEGQPHMVAPYTYYSAATEWPSTGLGSYVAGGGCQECITSGNMNSGVLKYMSPSLPQYENAVCNTGTGSLAVITDGAHGYCMGEPSTYSGRSEKISNRVQMPSSGDALLCPADGGQNTSSALQLGLCKCTKDFNGPTCAMPKTVAACGGGQNTIVSLPQSPYSDGEQYHVCICHPPWSGFYCNWRSDGAQLPGTCESIEVIGDEPTTIECNGMARCLGGSCGSSCGDDPTLDPYAYCREYKAVGPHGIRARHQQSVGLAAIGQTDTGQTAPGDGTSGNCTAVLGKLAQQVTNEVLNCAENVLLNMPECSAALN